MQNKISALLVVYNEEAVIERCLKSIENVVDEIIVIHDGPCNDNTLKLARKFTKKVHETKVRKGIGESWYIKGFNLCKFNWILRIDADEYISKELQKNLKSLIESDTCDAYSFVWPMWDGKKYIDMSFLRKNFLFRKSKIGFMDKFHYPIKVNGRVCRSELIVHHKPKYNNWSSETFEKKQKRWAKLQAKDFLEPIENREVYNLDIDDLKKEEKVKRLLYTFPFSVLIVTYLIHLKGIVGQPAIVFNRGYWIFGRITAKYSYEVAKEVKKLTSKTF